MRVAEGQHVGTRGRREYVRGSGHGDAEQEVVADLGCAVESNGLASVNMEARTSTYSPLPELPQ